VADVEHGDARQDESVAEGDQDVVERVREPSERDDPELRGAGDRAPERGLPGGF